MTTPKVMVIVPEGQPAPPLDRVERLAEVIVVRTAAEYLSACGTAEILFMNDFRTTLLRDHGPGSLRWIHTSSIGVDALLTEEIVSGGIVVSNSRGVCERPIAEWILGVILMFVKDLRGTVELQQRRTWRHRETESLLGRRVVVVGPGPVGRETALLLRAAGMEVSVVGRREREDAELGRIAALGALDELLGDAEDVVVALPLTEDTRGMFDAERFARMRPGSRFINVGRGPVVVEADLLAAVESGHLAGAALDVFEQEPLPVTSGFWDRSDVLVSPHASGDLVGWRGRVADRFADNLERWLRGEPLADVVDVHRMGATRSAPE